MKVLIPPALLLAASPAYADAAPIATASPWAAIAMLAVVIGMMAAIFIWRRRR